jgi:hypothetical protein
MATHHAMLVVTGNNGPCDTRVPDQLLLNKILLEAAYSNLLVCTSRQTQSNAHLNPEAEWVSMSRFDSLLLLVNMPVRCNGRKTLNDHRK